MRTVRIAVPLALGVLLSGCTSDPQAAAPSRSATTTQGTTSAPGSPSPSASASTATEPSAPVAFDADAAMATVRRLAGGIGPREATSDAYAEAAALVADRFRALGYGVRNEPFRVPRGVSWGVPVPAGRSANVVATPQGFRPDRPHVLVGAHLDTVPQAPGAEDNASGVAVLLELARLAAAEGTALPTVLVAFGAEEPRGSGDDRHHFGSQHHVQEMSPQQRRALVAMVSLDRVGTGSRVPVRTGGITPLRVRRELLAVARDLDIPTTGSTDNRASDHWSFEKAGVVAARLGSTPYAAYHSARDRPGVVRRQALERVGRVAWEWLRTGSGGFR